MPRNLPTSEQISRIIRLAWRTVRALKTSKNARGLVEKQVIGIMRAGLKPSSYRKWRKRVSGRVTNHRKLMENRFKVPDAETF